MTNDRITDAELAELRLLHEAATPGPWEIDRDEMAGETVVGVPTGKKGARWSSYRKVAVCDLDEADDGEFVSPNADFIAAACNDLHRLIDEIERLRELVCEVANSGVVWQAGAKYLEVQIGSETWKELQAELEKKP